MFCHPNSSIARTASHQQRVLPRREKKRELCDLQDRAKKELFESLHQINRAKRRQNPRIGSAKSVYVHISYTAQQVWTTRVSTQIH